VLQWSIEKQLELKPDEIGEHYGRYRLHIPEAERTMAKSLERYGQLSPVVVCLRSGRYELIDGTFDPGRLIQKFQDGLSFDWDDLRQLLNRAATIDRNRFRS
jgi:hypothetical protein